MLCSLRDMVLSNEPKLAKGSQEPENALSNGRSLPSSYDFTAVISSPHLCSQAGLYQLH